MKLTGLTLKQKLESERKNFFENIDIIKTVFSRVDFITNIKWLNDQEKTEIWVSSSSFIGFSVTLSISNVKIEEFIENVLGPYHRKYDIDWEMKVDEDKVIEFKHRNSDWYYIEHPIFRVKEGIFKSCTYKKEVIGFSNPVNAKPIYETKLVCE